MSDCGMSTFLLSNLNQTIINNSTYYNELYDKTLPGWFQWILAVLINVAILLLWLSLQKKPSQIYRFTIELSQNKQKN
jgi:hypothetical protein